MFLLRGLKGEWNEIENRCAMCKEVQQKGCWNSSVNIEWLNFNSSANISIIYGNFMRWLVIWLNRSAI